MLRCAVIECMVVHRTLHWPIGASVRHSAHSVPPSVGSSQAVAPTRVCENSLSQPATNTVASPSTRTPAPEVAQPARPPATRVKQPPKIKVRRRPPWGEIQLRDAWSEDAMARHDKDSVGERLHSEYRYHPGESHRQLFKKVMRIFVPTFVTLLLLWQRVATGYWMWQADLQTFLNSARNYDTSPRSRVSYTRKRSDRVPQPPPGALS